eukprot:5614727-Amphidinium_carterae.5
MFSHHATSDTIHTLQHHIHFTTITHHPRPPRKINQQNNNTSTLVDTHHHYHITTTPGSKTHINQVCYHDQSLTTLTSSSTTSASASALLRDILRLSLPLFTTSSTSRSQFDAHACTTGGGVATLLTRVQPDSANVGLATSLQATPPSLRHTIIYNFIATHQSLPQSTTTGK